EGIAVGADRAEGRQRPGVLRRFEPLDLDAGAVDLVRTEPEHRCRRLRVVGRRLRCGHTGRETERHRCDQGGRSDENAKIDDLSRSTHRYSLVVGWGPTAKAM